jgi:hypothetical protein
MLSRWALRLLWRESGSLRFLLLVFLSLRLAAAFGPWPQKVPTIYYFFPEYRGSEFVANVVDNSIAGFIAGLYAAPWLFLLSALAFVITMARPVENILRAIGRTLEPVNADGARGRTARVAVRETSAAVTFRSPSRVEALDDSRRLRRLFDLYNIVSGTASTLAIFIMALMVAQVLTSMLGSDVSGAYKSWNELWPLLLVGAATFAVLVLARFVHRRFWGGLFLALMLAVSGQLLFYLAQGIAVTWWVELGAARDVYVRHDWSVLYMPWKAHQHPSPGLIGAAFASTACLVGLNIGQRLRPVLMTPARLAGSLLQALGGIWLAAATAPALWQPGAIPQRLELWFEAEWKSRSDLWDLADGLASAIAQRLGLWFEAGWENIPVLGGAALRLGFVLGVGVLLWLAAARICLHFTYQAYLLTFSSRLTFAAAKYPTPKHVWPLILMTLGFSPANYLSPHTWWTSKIAHFLARIAGAISFWMFALMLYSFTTVLTLPMFETIWNFRTDAQNTDAFEYFFLIIVVAQGVAIGLRFVGNRFRPRLYETLAVRSSNPPVLFLRPFRDDRGKVDDWHWVPWRPVDAPRNIAEVLLDTAGCWGPVVGIGRPEDEFEPSGPYSIYVADADWRGVVSEITARALAVVILMDESAGLDWEIDHLLERGYLSKSIFLFRPRATREEAMRLVGRFGLALPELRGKAPIALIPDEHGWTLWTSRAHDVSVVYVALMQWLLLRFGYPETVWRQPSLSAPGQTKPK